MINNLASSNIYIVRDTRKFDKTSYSQYNKKSVFTEWSKAILHAQYETACHYVAEIDCSLWQDELWEKMIIFASRHIHLHNPSLPTFLNRQFTKYLELLKNETPTRLRNNESHRKILCQLTGIFVYSGKGPTYELPKIETNSSKIEELKNYSRHYVTQLTIKQGDSILLMTLLNGIFNYLEDGLIHKALECLAILLNIEKEMKKNKTDFIIENRIHKWIPAKFKNDWIWILWEGLLTWKHKNEIVCESIKSLLSLFSFQYLPTKKTSRIYLIINAFLLVCQPLNINQPIIDQQFMNIIKQACQNVNMMYKEIGENYETNISPVTQPQTEKSFTNLFIEDTFFAEDARKQNIQIKDKFNNLYGYESQFETINRPSKKENDELNSSYKLEMIEKLLYKL